MRQAIEEEEAMREKEHEDYLAAKDEMDKAVTALEAATTNSRYLLGNADVCP